jgi:hypothetical protein
MADESEEQEMKAEAAERYIRSRGKSGSGGKVV